MVAGTRIDDRFNKLWFTILDFKKATELFADERFDGIPEKVVQATAAQDINDDASDLEEKLNSEDTVAEPPGGWRPLLVQPQAGSGDWDFSQEADPGVTLFADDDVRMRKFFVNGVTVKAVAERVQYYDTDGKLVTESFRDYTRKTIARQFDSLDAFARKWHSADRKQAIIKELETEGVLWDVLEQEVGQEMDPFDLICHVVYDQPPLTRRERAEQVKKRNYFTKYSETAQAVLHALLDKYADEGVLEIENKNILKVAPFTRNWPPDRDFQKRLWKPGRL